MCNFFSGVLTKQKKVYFLPESDSHDDIIEIFRLQDEFTDSSRMQVARFELLPAADPFDLAAYAFKLDERRTPEWLNPAHIEAARKTFTDYMRGCLAQSHFPGDLYLGGYEHPLPATFTSCGGDLYLGGYEHPLPASFTSCEGDLDLRGYKHPLPATLTSCGGDLYFEGYKHPLPASFTSCEGDLDLRGYKHPLPVGLLKRVGVV